MNEQEKRMIERAKAGDEDAFDQLFRTFYPMAYGMAMRYTKCDADAKDAVQESFLSIRDNIGQLREADAFPAWLKTIVHSKCYKLFRRHHDIAMDVSQSMAQSKEQRSYMNPQLSADYHSEQEVLNQLIHKLKPKLQEAITLVYLKQLKIDEAAQYLNVSPSVVKTRVHRAKKELAHQVALFEKQNQRKLTFYHEGLLTVTMGAFFAHLKQNIMQIRKVIQANALTSACAMSLSVLAMSGAVMAYDDWQAENNVSDIDAHSMLVQPSNSETLRLPKTSKQIFTPVSYQEQWISNSRFAYFACLRFAQNKEEMQKHTSDELKEILPLLEALKQQNDEYYHKLVSDGWERLLMQEIALKY